jgi:hypothetical protein
MYRLWNLEILKEGNYICVRRSRSAYWPNRDTLLFLAFRREHVNINGITSRRGFQRAATRIGRFGAQCSGRAHNTRVWSFRFWGFGFWTRFRRRFRRDVFCSQFGFRVRIGAWVWLPKPRHEAFLFEGVSLSFRLLRRHTGCKEEND